MCVLLRHNALSWWKFTSGPSHADPKLGWDPAVATRVEGARGRMKRLVQRGWLVQERPGWFMLPAPGPAAAAT
ncbi:hypothetical protein FE633_20335 [Streptomyces montanus]|uniref:Uncharacterized protein n=1 Tax=Streptomyces montanus TaxID=2580423 RepID=A0A5R9FQG0_9ACTN|nr:hypothetical protein FE633_20335 [Streptomyces montanus]